MAKIQDPDERLFIERKDKTVYRKCSRCRKYKDERKFAFRLRRNGERYKRCFACYVPKHLQEPVARPVELLDRPLLKDRTEAVLYEPFHLFHVGHNPLKTSFRDFLRR